MLGGGCWCWPPAGSTPRAGGGLKIESPVVRGSIQPVLPPPASASAFVSGAQPRFQSSKC